MWVDVQQNTDEWFKLRLGKPTSSQFGKIMANMGKAFGDPAKEYAEQLAAEIVTGVKDPNYSFSNQWMDRGNELEPIALEAYEEETMYEVTNGGFFIEDCDHQIICGDSNDGNVGVNGCIEIKSVIAKTHWKRLKLGRPDPSYKWQYQGHIWLGKKQWCDNVSYCPEMPNQKKLLIFRVEKDNDMINQMEDRMSLFKKEVLNNIEILLN